MLTLTFLLRMILLGYSWSRRFRFCLGEDVSIVFLQLGDQYHFMSKGTSFALEFTFSMNVQVLTNLVPRRLCNSYNIPNVSLQSFFLTVRGGCGVWGDVGVYLLEQRRVVHLRLLLLSAVAVDEQGFRLSRVIRSRRP
jgi:hypothetical protein